LTISVAPSFASKWLLPRLPGFYDSHPDIELRISASVGIADFKRDKVDLAIRLGHGRYPGLHAEPLFNEALTPLCSPDLLKGKGRLDSPDDLRKHRLIHDMSIPGGGDSAAWDSWLALAGAKQVAANRGAKFSLAELAMQAAIDGVGGRSAGAPLQDCSTSGCELFPGQVQRHGTAPGNPGLPELAFERAEKGVAEQEPVPVVIKQCLTANRIG
jgi:LysR family glycine cleavage system transcriptional activator